MKNLNKKPLSMKNFGLLLEKSSIGLLRYSGTKRGAIRLVAKDHKKIITETRIKTILTKTGSTILSVLQPKLGFSNKFKTFVINNQNKNYNVVVSPGLNRGQVYENEFCDEIKNVATSKKIPDHLLQIFEKIKINPNLISTIIQTSNKRVKRPLTNQLSNIANVISDITITLLTGKKIYISLKNVNGSTFANSGYKQAFLVKDNQFVRSNPHNLDRFIEALGIDKDLAAKGFEKYLFSKSNNQNPTQMIEHKTNPKQDFGLVTDYLESAFGYGYWYVRQGKNSFDIKNLTKKQYVKNIVGKINKIDIKYPGRSKQITVHISTSQYKFVIEVRNSQGMIDPNEIKIKII